ncbi:heat shock protein 90 [Petrotoga miotherma DSM 10691]|uniref:Chaperone protein HtpG n=1 Tax=Petrotoga miotherma DSM 10691 TaxID=1434326 RepID=A0A2K1PHJ2_9BACT|nr:molecular chaperone HtpG [Petrotoga miotherma]PNS02127.1 heat shock protein 90 [Petrotoga miotherma DSM 10691]
MPEVKEFQAETKQLLNLIINSIYTHKDIFLRELISNASDALDKIRFLSLKDPGVLQNDTELQIRIEIDKDNNTLIVEDNGIGMSYEEVIENLGTIAKSGTKNFLEQLKQAQMGDSPTADKENTIINLIGQFGVGFYSVFMVAKKVIVETKKWDQDKGVRWESDGIGTYSIEECEKANRGTKITLILKDDLDEDENYLDQYKIQELVKKHSNYIKYPIKMKWEEEVEAGKKKITDKILNSMVPLWNKNKEEISQNEYNEFYKEHFYDWNDPFDVIHFKAEGTTVEFTALLYIPSKLPFTFFSKDYKRGLNLYSKNVFIMENCEEVLPDYLGFVKGLVDSPDFSLNISREILQKNKQLKVIRKNIERKILDALKSKLENEREKYVEFWKEFGKVIKAGLYQNILEKEKVQDLLLFESSTSDKNMVTLKEYISKMKEDQGNYIYYAVGESKDIIENLPQMETFKEKGYEVLYLTDEIDEFLIKLMHDYEGKEFKSISSSNVKIDEKFKEKEEENKDLLQKIKEYLKDKVKDVRLTDKLKESPACIVSANEAISLNMEKTLKNLEQLPFEAEKILELNPDHQVFKILTDIYHKDPHSEEIKDYAELLYNQSLLLEGLEIEDKTTFAKLITKLMIKSKK